MENKINQNRIQTLENISKGYHKVPLLLIDDNLIDNFINQSMLELFGVFDITVFSSARLALEHLSETNMKYRYIFVDLIMPIMDGFKFIELFNDLQLNQKQGQLIILSVSINPIDHLKANDLNLNYIEKPLTIDKLSFIQNVK